MGDPTPTSIETEEDAMRKLIVTNIVSLDGYFEGPGKDILALPMDMSFDTHNAERLREADTELLGRTTYEGFKGFWPGVADDPRASADQLGVPVELLDTPSSSGGPAGTSLSSAAGRCGTISWPRAWSTNST
jgi:hypothetical protein